MASVSDLDLRHRIFIKAYRFRRLDPIPWTTPSRPLARSRVAIVTTAAFHFVDQPPFDVKVPGGDPSFRVLRIREPDGSPSTRLKDLHIAHRSSAFDVTGIAGDYNMALPVDRFLELEREGVVGTLHDDAVSFMGSITAPGRLVKETAPGAADVLRRGAVDVAFLCPV